MRMLRIALLGFLLLWLAGCVAPARPLSSFSPVTLSSGWSLQDAAKLSEAGGQLSRVGYDARGWYRAVVPGTVLTTLVAAGVYREPLFGENNRPDQIPESLCRTSYWYRTEIDI